jgi:RNA processing factor Prp31
MLGEGPCSCLVKADLLEGRLIQAEDLLQDIKKNVNLFSNLIQKVYKLTDKKYNY